MSANRLGKSGRLFFWTFTFKEVLSIKETRSRWNHFLTLLKRRWPKMSGLRVFEMHEEHGLHVHLLTDRFLDVNEARKLAARAGWGRIHVMRIPAAKAGYLAKYLSKEREPCLKGWRLWAGFGKNWEWVKVKHVEVDSVFSRTFRTFGPLFKARRVPFPEQVCHVWRAVIALIEGDPGPTREAETELLQRLVQAEFGFA